MAVFNNGLAKFLTFLAIGSHQPKETYLVHQWRLVNNSTSAVTADLRKGFPAVMSPKGSRILPQNMSLWHKDYFRLIFLRNSRQEKLKTE